SRPINKANINTGDQSSEMTACTRLVVTPLMFRIWLNDTEQTIMIMIIEVVQAVAFKASRSLLKSRVANRLQMTSATMQPTAADSVGVATPVMIRPMMATMIKTNGRAFKARPSRIGAASFVSAGDGGASDGLSFTRKTTYPKNTTAR